MSYWKPFGGIGDYEIKGLVGGDSPTFHIYNRFTGDRPARTSFNSVADAMEWLNVRGLGDNRDLCPQCGNLYWNGQMCPECGYDTKLAQFSKELRIENTWIWNFAGFFELEHRGIIFCLFEPTEDEPEYIVLNGYSGEEEGFRTMQEAIDFVDDICGIKADFRGKFSQASRKTALRWKEEMPRVFCSEGEHFVYAIDKTKDDIWVGVYDKNDLNTAARHTICADDEGAREFCRSIERSGKLPMCMGRGASKPRRATMETRSLPDYGKMLEEVSKRDRKPRGVKKQSQSNDLAFQPKSPENILRDLIIDEQEAIQGYASAIELLGEGFLRDGLTDIMNEEKAHVGELQALLVKLNSEEEELFDEGVQEVENTNSKKGNTMTAKARKAVRSFMAGRKTRASVLHKHIAAKSDDVLKEITEELEGEYLETEEEVRDYFDAALRARYDRYFSQDDMLELAKEFMSDTQVKEVVKEEFWKKVEDTIDYSQYVSEDEEPYEAYASRKTLKARHARKPKKATKYNVTWREDDGSQWGEPHEESFTEDEYQQARDLTTRLYNDPSVVDESVRMSVVGSRKTAGLSFSDMDKSFDYVSGDEAYRYKFKNGNELVLWENTDEYDEDRSTWKAEIFEATGKSYTYTQEFDTPEEAFEDFLYYNEDEVDAWDGLSASKKASRSKKASSAPFYEYHEGNTIDGKGTVIVAQADLGSNPNVMVMGTNGRLFDFGLLPNMTYALRQARVLEGLSIEQVAALTPKGHGMGRNASTKKASLVWKEMPIDDFHLNPSWVTEFGEYEASVVDESEEAGEPWFVYSIGKYDLSRGGKVGHESSLEAAKQVVEDFARSKGASTKKKANDGWTQQGQSWLKLVDSPKGELAVWVEGTNWEITMSDDVDNVLESGTAGVPAYAKHNAEEAVQELVSKMAHRARLQARRVVSRRK